MESQTVVIGVHGFNVANPTRTVGKIREPYENLGAIVEILNYGYVPFFWTVKKVNPGIAKNLDDRVRYWKSKGKRVIVFTHSNGSTIAHLAGRIYNTPIDTLVCINPALKKTLDPCHTAEKVYVFFNSGDRPVRVSKWLNWIVPDRIDEFRPWGEMGRVGYKGKREDVINVDCESYFKGRKANGHSAIFEGDNADFFLPRIAPMTLYDIER